MIRNFFLGRGLNKVQEILSKALRHASGLAGGYLLAHGATQDQATAITGGILAGGAFLWSFARTFAESSLTKSRQGGFARVGFLVTLCAMGGAFLFAVPARADILSISWVAPTAYNDGSPLDPMTDLETYQLGCGPVTGDRTTLTKTWAGTTTPPRAETFTPGTYFCALRVLTSAASPFPNVWSDWGNEVSFTVAVKPNAPTMLTVN